VFAAAQTSAASFNANQLNVLVIQKTRKNAYGVTSAPHTSNYYIRQSAQLVEALLPGFFSDTALEMPYYGGIWMRPAG
jgi:hypothetical protein